MNYNVIIVDWGSMITVSLSQMYPTRVHGIHVTMVSPFKGSPIDQIVYGALLELAPNYMLTDAEKESNQTFTPLKRFRKLISKTGYLHYQATKPDTLGFGLTDSPVGLMTYLLEKYAFGSFSYYDVVNYYDGNLEEFSKDDLLTIVTIYWMTNSITSSMRIYKWVFDKFSVNLGWPKAVIDSFPTPKSVPVAVMYAKNEIDHVPYCLLKNIFGNLKQYNILKKGGHFIAFHEPELALSDLMTFIDSVLA
jgi:microsomal epoxide hydrolase